MTWIVGLGITVALLSVAVAVLVSMVANAERDDRDMRLTEHERNALAACVRFVNLTQQTRANRVTDPELPEIDIRDAYSAVKKINLRSV